MKLSKTLNNHNHKGVVTQLLKYFHSLQIMDHKTSTSVLSSLPQEFVGKKTNELIFYKVEGKIILILFILVLF